MNDKLMTVPEVAEYLGLKESTIYNMISQGRLEVVKLGRRMVRVKRSYLEAITAAGTIRKVA